MLLDKLSVRLRSLCLTAVMTHPLVDKRDDDSSGEDDAKNSADSC